MQSGPSHRLPPFAVVMKVGPHSGMSLSEIVASKVEEESRLGQHYWGYSGTLCHPKRVLEFVEYVRSLQELPPQLLLLETASNYDSSIGKINSFSTDCNRYEVFGGAVQLQGAEFAFVAQGLHSVDRDICLDEFDVVGGKNNGQPLSHHLRHRVNKAFVKRRPADEREMSQRCRLSYVAQLVSPFVIWLRSELDAELKVTPEDGLLFP